MSSSGISRPTTERSLPRLTRPKRNCSAARPGALSLAGGWGCRRVRGFHDSGNGFGFGCSAGFDGFGVVAVVGAGHEGAEDLAVEVVDEHHDRRAPARSRQSMRSRGNEPAVTLSLFDVAGAGV